MKTLPPNDWSKTPDEHLRASYMGKSKQYLYLYRLFFLVALITLGAWCVNELYETYTASEARVQK